MPDQTTAQKSAKSSAGKILEATTPDCLVPQMNRPVNEVATYRTLHMVKLPGYGDNLKDIDKPLNPFGEAVATIYGKKPAVGALLTHKQSWKQTGLSLGSLLHSVCLAPGEVTKIAMIDWRRRTGARASEGIDERERLENEARQNRAVTEVQNAVAQEATWGKTTSSSTSTTREHGASGSWMGLFGGSAGSSTTTTKAMSVSMNVGERSIAANANQDVHQATMEASQAARSRRATVVKEIEESETEALTTRVVANYNHMHAMTVLFFEVLQTFKLKTRVARAERCVFIPMEVIAFTPAAIDTHFETLLEIATDMGLDDLRHVLLMRTDPERKRLKALRKSVEEQSAAIGKDWRSMAQALMEFENIETWKVLKQDRARMADSFATFEKAPGSARSRQASIAGLRRYIASFDLGLDCLRKASDLASSRQLGDVGSTQRKETVRSLLELLAGVLENFAKARTHFWSSIPVIRPKVEALVELGHALESQAEALARVETELEAGVTASRIDEERLTQALEARRLFFNQQIWLRMDGHRVNTMLADKKVDEEPLLGQVDPTPVGVFGNYVAYRWNFRASDGSKEAPVASRKGGRATKPAATAAAGLDEQRRLDFLADIGLPPRKPGEDAPDMADRRIAGSVSLEDFGGLFDATEAALAAATEEEVEVALPSDGLFAEAVLGQAFSAEKIDLSRFWKWQDSPIPILPPEMKPIGAGSRARDVDVSLGALGPSLVRLFGPQAMPAPTDIAAVMENLTKSEIFEKLDSKDVAELAKVLATTSAKSASHASDTAVQANKNMLDALNKLAETAGGSSETSVLGGLLNVNPDLVKTAT